MHRRDSKREEVPRFAGDPLRLVTHLLLAVLGVVLLGAGAGVMLGAFHAERNNPRLVVAAPFDEGLSPDARREGAVMSTPEPPGRRAAPPLATDAEASPPVPRKPLLLAGFTPPRRPHSDEPPVLQGRPRKRPAPRARLAIIIDDIGHNLRAPRNFLGLNQPVTFSVLPDLPYSEQAAAMIRNRGREFIVHLPMEPLEYPAKNPGPHPLLLSLDLTETRARLLEYLSELPGAIGASNHMGSAYTADPERMTLVQTVLAQHDLFFLNSKTDPTPIPAEIARQRGYRYLERDVFLDHDPSEPAVERAYRRALARARAHGSAIAIGHPHAITFRVLKREFSRANRHGVTLVTLSALLTR